MQNVKNISSYRIWIVGGVRSAI